MKTPYYAIIFTSVRTQDDPEGYAKMSDEMEALASTMPGYLGMESARNEVGITVSYWESPEAIRHWKLQTDHLAAQRQGRADWYKSYRVRVCKVEREYGFGEE